MLRSLWSKITNDSDSSEEGDWDPVTAISEEDWPWVWAIHDVEVLDWKKGCQNDEEIQTMAVEQSKLPVLISSYRKKTGEVVSVYLSGAKYAHDVELLKSRGITHVLNVAGRVGQGDEEQYKGAGIL